MRFRIFTDELGETRGMLKYVWAWMPMILIAIFNGMLRDKWYGKSINKMAAHQISSLTGIFL
jgi:hypothetical protein